MRARDNGVGGRDSQLRVGGVHTEHFQADAAKRGHAGPHLVAEIVTGQIMDLVQADGALRVDHVRHLGQAARLGQAAGHVVGAGVEVAGQLRHLGEGADHRLVRVRGGAGGVDDLARGREGGRIPGERGHGGDAGVQGEVVEVHLDTVLAELGEQVAGHRVDDRLLVDHRGGDAVPGDERAHVALDHLADPLEDGLLAGVAGRGAVELVDGVKPGKGHEHR